MADYVVSFIGHIVPSLRPHGFPSFVKDDLVCRVDSLDTLKKITDNVDRTVEQKQVNPTPTGV